MSRDVEMSKDFLRVEGRGKPSWLRDEADEVRPCAAFPSALSRSLRGAPTARALCRRPDPVPDLSEISRGSRADGWARGRDTDWQQEGELSSFGQQPGLRGFTQETRARIVLAAPRQPVSHGAPFSALSRRIGTSSVSPRARWAQKAGIWGRGAFVPL